MRKRGIILTAAVFLMTVCFGCNKPQPPAEETPAYSETFVGAVSQAVYESKDAAAEAFLENEINGVTTQATLVDVAVKKELTQEEVAALPLDEETKSELASVEEVTISYRSESIDTFAVREADTADVLSTRAYLLTYTDGAYRYFVPPLLTGETLTKSYYESVFDPEKYLNCTFTFHSTGIQGPGVDWDVVAKIAENGYCEQDTAKMGLMKERLEVWEFYAQPWAYSVDDYDGEGYECGREKMSESEFSESMKETAGYILGTWFGGDIDYTYFEKTETGFAVRADKAVDFMRHNDIGVEADDFTIEFNMYVVDGRIYKCYQKYSYSENGKTGKGSYELFASDFGTTTLDIPDAVWQAVADAYPEG